MISPPPSREKLPISGNYAEMPRAWLKWFTDISTQVGTAATVTWQSISKTGSNLADLETRNHSALQNLNTADYAHLYLADRDNLVGGADTVLHYHASDRSDVNQTFSDVTTNDASTAKHGFLLKAIAPAVGVRNVVAIDNGETIYKNTALFDSYTPANLAGTASSGTSLIAARQDHVHIGLTPAQLTELTGGGETALHTHKWPTVSDVVDVGETVTIGVNRQLIICGMLTNNGMVHNSGKVIKL